MALITCAECSKEVSEFAPACPHCGFPIAAITMEGRVALRNCPECHGTGVYEQPCINCDQGKRPCGYCRSGYIYEDVCKYCNGTCLITCDTCQGKGTDSWDCETCNHSGQVTLREYEEIIAQRQRSEESEEQLRQAKFAETQRREQEEVAAKLIPLRERLAEVKGELLQLGLAQSALILADPAYAVDRAKIMKVHGEQLQALRGYRYQCQFCGEPLEWKERFRKLKVHDTHVCKEGWERVSKKIVENNARYDEFMQEHADQSDEEE